jgi:hypothetical protein
VAFRSALLNMYRTMATHQGGRQFVLPAQITGLACTGRDNASGGTAVDIANGIEVSKPPPEGTFGPALLSFGREMQQPRFNIGTIPLQRVQQFSR